MRHRTKTKQLGRSSSYRAATIRSLVKAVLKYQRIKTTKTRAKVARQQLERLISLAKEGSLYSKRLSYRLLGEHLLVRYLFADIAKRFKERTSGFSRIVHLNQRRGDNAQMVVLELTEIKREAKQKKTKEKAIKEEEKPQIKPASEEKPPTVIKEKHKIKEEKPTKKFLGGLRTLFKKERDSL